MKNIVLIDPEGYTRGLNVGLGYLSAILVKNEYNLKVLDYNNNARKKDKRLESVRKADFVGISIKTLTVENGVNLARKIKQVNKDVKIVCGGPHVILDGLDFLKEHEEFDIGVVGEGEEALLEIVSGKDLNEIKGIIYRSKRDIFSTPRMEWNKNLDEIPFPNYDYFDSVPEVIKSAGYPILTSRGCPFNCTYCSVREISGRAWRARSPQNILDELHHAKDKHKIKEFYIVDDNFTLNMNRAKDFCQMLVSEKMNLNWSCPNGVRADSLDKELLCLMKESGCTSISLGIESGVPEVFGRIKKGEKLDDIENAVKMAKDCGVKVFGFFIIGLPGSTFELDKKSVEFAKRIGLKKATWNLLVPYPRTEVWRWVQENGIVLRDWKEGYHFGAKPKIVFETREYTERERIDAFYSANLAAQNYAALVNENAPIIGSTYNLLKVILKYDSKNILSHLWRLSSKVISKWSKKLSRWVEM